MTETWCGLLDALILMTVAGVNGVLLRRTRGLGGGIGGDRSGSGDE